ncbi:MAG TPA: porin family protein [Candidatus Eisenbacteria bacterium]
MRTNLAAIALSCLLATPALAGPYSIGLRAGSSIPNLRAGNDDPVSTGWSTRVAPYFGVFADFAITPAFSIRPEIAYAAQGGKRDGMQPVPDASSLGFPPGVSVYANYDNVAKLDYLEIPVLARYRFGAGRGFYVNAGPYAGILLAAKNETSGASPLYLDAAGTQPVLDQGGNPVSADFNASTDVKGDLNTFNWGLQGGGGYAHPLGRGTLELDVRGGLGLANVQKDTAANGKNSTGNLVIAAGYSWSLGAP